MPLLITREDRFTRASCHAMRARVSPCWRVDMLIRALRVIKDVTRCQRCHDGDVYAMLRQILLLLRRALPR